MSEETMKAEILRIVNVALDWSAENEHFCKGGTKTPAGSYRCGYRDALNRVAEEIVQSLGMEIENGKAIYG